MRRRWASLLTAAVLLGGAARASADEMLAWDKVATATMRQERLTREDSDRSLALVRAAVDDAMNQASPVNAGLSADLAAAAAAHRVLTTLFPARKAKLDARLERSFAGRERGLAEQAYAIGAAAADAVLATQWKWNRPRVRPIEGSGLPDQALPSRSRLSEPLPGPKAVKLRRES